MTADMVADPGEGLFEDFFAHCPAMFFVADPGGVLLRRSAALSRFLGASAEMSTSLADLVHPDDRGAFAAAWERLAGGLDAVAIEVRLRADDHAHRAVSVSARRSPARGEIHGEIRTIAAAPGSISEGAPPAAEALRVLLETLPVVLWTFDPQGICTFSAGKALAAIGLKPGAHVGKSVFDLMVGSPNIAYARAALAGTPGHTSGALDAVSWDSWYIPLKDAQGEVTAVVGIALDLSEPRRAERELRDKMALIERQQAVIRDLATPILEVWDKVLTVPMIGVIDSMRAAELMENLLAHVSRKGSRIAILDLTGVDAIDTSTASHLIKLTQALKLLGADAVVTGIQPSVAQTMVALGVDMESITTSAKLRDGLRLSIRRLREEKG